MQAPPLVLGTEIVPPVHLVPMPALPVRPLAPSVPALAPRTATCPPLVPAPSPDAPSAADTSEQHAKEPEGAMPRDTACAARAMRSATSAYHIPLIASGSVDCCSLLLLQAYAHPAGLDDTTRAMAARPASAAPAAFSGVVKSDIDIVILDLWSKVAPPESLLEFPPRSADDGPRSVNAEGIDAIPQ